MPRITDIRAFMLSASVGEARAFGNARGRYATRGSIIIEVTSDDGLKGWGEAWGAAPLRGAPRCDLSAETSDTDS